MLSGAPTKFEEEAAKYLFELAMDILEWTGKRAKELVEIQHASHNYAKHFAGRHGQIRVLGMSEPVPIREIYTAVQLLNPDDLRGFSSPEYLASAYQQRGIRRFIQEVEKRDGVEVANKTQFLNILGQPGAGKSTFLKRLGIEALNTENRAYHHKLLPVLIELKTFKRRNVNLLDAITDEFRTCGFTSAEGFVDRALNKGKLLILLDGLDEVPADKLDEVLDEIRDFVDRHHSNRFLTSCRTAFYKTWFTRFTDVILADFDDDRIHTFIQNWFRSALDKTEGTAAHLWDLLLKSEHAPILELARTPLLLTFVCLQYDTSQRLPSNRSDLYEEALKILLEKWAAEKRIFRDATFKRLPPKLEILLLEFIAGDAFEDAKLFFDRHELSSRIEAFLKDTHNAPPGLDAQEILRAIEVEQGLFVERANGVYSFSHLTLQEYLAARSFLSAGKIPELIETYLVDARWREVFLLTMGMTQADDLLLRMSALVEKMASNRHWIRNILFPINQIVVEASGESRAANCAAALATFVTLLNRPTIAKSFAVARDLATRLNPKTSLKLVATLNWEVSDGLYLSRAFESAHRHDDPMVRASVRQKLRNVDLQNIHEGVCHVVAALDGIIKPELLAKAQNCLNMLRGSVPPENRELNEKKEFIEKLRVAVCESFAMDEATFIIPLENANELLQYLNAALLLVECKDAALRVSSETWTKIVGRLLTVPA